MLLPDDFYRMSWREFFLLSRGRRKKEEDDFLKQTILTREIAYQVYCSIPLKNNKRHMSKSKYWKLSIDKEKEQKELENMRKTMEALKNKHNGTRD